MQQAHGANQAGAEVGHIEDAHNRFAVQPGAARQGQSLAQGSQLRRDEQVADQLHRRAGAARADVMHRRRKTAKQRLGVPVRRFSAAADEVEPPLPRFRLAAEDGRVEITASPRRHRLRKPNRNDRIRRGRMDHQDFGGEVVEEPPVEHRGLCVRSGDADKDDGLAVNRGSNGVRASATRPMSGGGGRRVRFHAVT